MFFIGFLCVNPVQKYIKFVNYKSKLTIKYEKKLHLGMKYYKLLLLCMFLLLSVDILAM